MLNQNQINPTSTNTPILNQLINTKPQRPPEYQPLFNFKRFNVAQYLKINPSYFSNVITGVKKPSPELHKKIIELVQQIESEKNCCKTLCNMDLEVNVGGNESVENNSFKNNLTAEIKGEK